MVKVNVLEIDVKTGKSEVVEKEVELPTAPPEPKGTDLNELAKLIEYAKSKGWI